MQNRVAGGCSVPMAGGTYVGGIFTKGFDRDKKLIRLLGDWF